MKNIVFISECCADGCYKKSVKGEQLCKYHLNLYNNRIPFKAFYGRTLLKQT